MTMNAGLLVALIIVTSLFCFVVLAWLLLFTIIRKQSFEVSKRNYALTVWTILWGLAVLILVLYETCSNLHYSKDQVAYEAAAARNCKTVSLAQDLIIPFYVYSIQTKFYRFLQLQTKNTNAKSIAKDNAFARNRTDRFTLIRPIKPQRFRLLRKSIIWIFPALIVILACVWIGFYVPLVYPNQLACVNDQILVLPAFISLLANVVSSIVSNTLLCSPYTKYQYN